MTTSRSTTATAEVDAWLEADVGDGPSVRHRMDKGQNNAAKSTAHGGILNDEDTEPRDAALRMWGKRPPRVNSESVPRSTSGTGSSERRCGGSQ